MEVVLHPGEVVLIPTFARREKANSAISGGMQIGVGYSAAMYKEGVSERNLVEGM
jgi:hypothetical protein